MYILEKRPAQEPCIHAKGPTDSRALCSARGDCDWAEDHWWICQKRPVHMKIDLKRRPVQMERDQRKAGRDRDGTVQHTATHCNTLQLENNWQHVAQINNPWQTYEGVRSHIWLSHVRHEFVTNSCIWVRIYDHVWLAHCARHAEWSTYMKRDPQKRPTKETYTHQKRPIKETLSLCSARRSGSWQSFRPSTSVSKETYIHEKRPTNEA